MGYKERRQAAIDALISLVSLSKPYQSRKEWYEKEGIRQKGFPTLETLNGWMKARHGDGMRLYNAFEAAGIPGNGGQANSQKWLKKSMPGVSNLLAELARQEKEEPYSGPKTMAQWHKSSKIGERFGIVLS